MKGIQKHSHKEREQVILDLISLLEKKFGNNFIALGAEGSYARNEDKTYSDLELTAFVKNKKVFENWEIRKIINGLLIVVVFDTKESYIEKYLEVTSIWYATGAGKMLPIVNEEFIETLNNHKPANVQKKCLEQIQNRWPHFQEITSKLLNGIESGNKEAVALCFQPFIKELLVILAYLNQTPFLTLVGYIEQAKSFKLLPANFHELTSIFVQGDHSIKSAMVASIFEEMETMIEKQGITLYPQELGNE